MILKKTVRSQEGIFETISSISSFKENQGFSQSENKSKAYIAAMKALQEKIATIELENSSLTEKLKNAELKIIADKQDLELKLLESIQKCEKNEKIEKIEKSQIFRINELEKTEKELTKRNTKQEEIIKFLEKKLKYNEDNIKRITEQHNIDKENLLLEVYCLKKLMNYIKKQENFWKKKCENGKREYDLIFEELSQQKQINNSLEDELQFIRDNTDIERSRIEENYQCFKSEMIQQNQESIQLIKKLSIKNKSLQQIVNESKKKGEYYKIQYSKLSQRERASQDLKGGDNKKSRSKSKIIDKRIKSDVTNSKSSFGFCDYSNIGSISSGYEEGDINKAIKISENEIKVLNEKYKKLQDVQLDTSGIDLHRRNLEDICVNMEKKNKELFELKKHQRDYLKLKLL